MAKRRRGVKLPSEGKTDATQNITVPKKKKNHGPKRLEDRKIRGSSRVTKLIGTKEEEELRKGMSIRDNALRDKGFEVKQEEDRSEQLEIEHFKKVTFGAVSYPSRSPSEPLKACSVSSHVPVRSIMRRFTRKSITKAINTLKVKVQDEKARILFDALSKATYARNDPKARRTKAIFQKSFGEACQPFPRREEELRFLIQQDTASRKVPMHRAVSARAKAALQASQKS